MGFIIIDEGKLYDNIAKWNSKSYRDQVTSDVYNAKVDYSHFLEALQQAEAKIDADIKKLEDKKSSIGSLMQYAK
jgi:hypothetical protein